MLPLYHLLGHILQDLTGARLAALVNQQFVGQVIGRFPEAGAAE